jgi:hypothetical protein
MKKKPETLTAARFATVLRVVAELLDETATDSAAEGTGVATPPSQLPRPKFSVLLKQRRQKESKQASGKGEDESGDVGGALVLEQRRPSRGART